MRGQYEYPQILEDDPRDFFGEGHHLGDWTPSGLKRGFQFMQDSGSAQAAAARGLFHLMCGLSEEYYCTSWLNNLEYALWQRREFGPGGEGQFSKLTERHCMLLRLLSEECGSWWIQSPEHSDALQLLPLDQWRTHIARNWVHPGGFRR